MPKIVTAFGGTEALQALPRVTARACRCRNSGPRGRSPQLGEAELDGVQGGTVRRQIPGGRVVLKGHLNSALPCRQLRAGSTNLPFAGYRRRADAPCVTIAEGLAYSPSREAGRRFEARGCWSASLPNSTPWRADDLACRARQPSPDRPASRVLSQVVCVWCGVWSLSTLVHVRTDCPLGGDSRRLDASETCGVAVASAPVRVSFAECGDDPRKGGLRLRSCACSRSREFKK